MAECAAGEPAEGEAMTEGETRGTIDEITVRIVDALYFAISPSR